MPEKARDIFKGLKKNYKKGSIKEDLSFYFSLGEKDKWTVKFVDGKVTVEEGKTVDNADCVFVSSPELFVKIWRGEYKPGTLDFISGKLKTNDPTLLKQFQEAFKT
ncbi:MAG: SCP2 sterol-binding domain-containing protein [Acidobacteria bacterium]|nr:SCP2 sterol-binding domain-containing protein [Acidobacteriota bacterium]MBI3656141.1 SCP2 sterol-binding domain-containing protein [Acidobacteriota bacterium]